MRARHDDDSSLETLLHLIRAGDGISRAELMAQTGLRRTTAASRVAELLDRGLIVEIHESTASVGRPAGTLIFNARAGVILAVDVGASRGALEIADLAGEVLTERSELPGIDAGPDVTLARICEQLDALLEEIGRSHTDVRGIAVALPGSVDFAAGRPVSPYLMPGWDGFPVADTLRAHFGVDVLVDNDANVMALGEASLRGIDGPVVMLKAGTGVGLGHVVQGAIQRGAQGCAGEIGHVRTVGHDDLRCRCGRFGCLEAVAGGTAMAERLAAAGIPCTGAADVAALARTGVPEAIAMVREAGHAIGHVLATVVNVLNPTRLVVGGDLTEARDFLLSALRETVYREANPLATSELEIAGAQAGVRAGLAGATALALGHALAV